MFSMRNAWLGVGFVVMIVTGSGQGSIIKRSLVDNIQNGISLAGQILGEFFAFQIFRCDRLGLL